MADFQRPFSLPPGATEVVFVRHGSTGIDGPAVHELLDGQADPALNEMGRRQAAAVAAHLGGAEVAKLFVTPLKRTAETAAPLAERLGLEPVAIHDLREVFLGEWEGEFNERMRVRDPLSPRIFSEGRWDVIPGAERQEDFAERVLAGADRAAAEIGPDRSGVAVVHGGVIAEICRQATNGDAFAFLFCENGSINRLLRLPTGRWALRGFNDVGHLHD